MQGKKWNDYLKAETILILIINFKNIKFIYLIVKIELSLSVIKVVHPLPLPFLRGTVLYIAHLLS